MTEATVLVVDNEPVAGETAAALLSQAGLDVSTARDAAAAIELARRSEYEVAVVDLSVPSPDNMDTIRHLKETSVDTEIIVLTRPGSLDPATRAIHEHIFDHLVKPADMNTLTRMVERAVERRRLRLQNRTLIHQLEMERSRLQEHVSESRCALDHRLSVSPILVGQSEAMAQVRRFIAEVAPSDMTVLIRGESGTGKDVVARLIHESSGRARTGAFVKINCPAIPETLLESELFGHESGAFTGAKKRKPGRIELAANGTMFLDEIGEMPPGLQAKLLQVIEHKQLTRLGGGETIRVDTRIVAATNAALETMIAGGRLRPDLFYRLNEYSIHLSPLRERVEDIPLLVHHFQRQYCEQFGRKDLTVSPEVLARLIRYPWPGNVRELQTVIKRFVFSGRDDVFDDALGEARTQVPDSPAPDRLSQVEIQTIMAALMQARWNQRRAAKILGIGYSALRRRIAKYDLKNRWCA
jgi:DNA-binding NtrC family response regulator